MAIIISFPATMLTWLRIGPSYIVMLKIEDNGVRLKMKWHIEDETLGEINAYVIKEYSRYLDFYDRGVYEYNIKPLIELGAYKFYFAKNARRLIIREKPKTMREAYNIARKWLSDDGRRSINFNSAFMWIEDGKVCEMLLVKKLTLLEAADYIAKFTGENIIEIIGWMVN
jgi:hypothetical protein